MKAKVLAYDALIIACYTGLTLAGGTFSFGFLQIRIAEVLVLLCLFEKHYILTMTLACFFSNLIGLFLGFSVFPVDVFIGTAASFASCVCVYGFRNIMLWKRPILSMFSPSLINGVMIGWELSFFMNDPSLFIPFFFYISLGELISVMGIGLFGYRFLCHIYQTIRL